jgi:DNA polymerase I-like protein with 3'-5' exonuclease and polymerase domains
VVEDWDFYGELGEDITEEAPPTEDTSKDWLKESKLFLVSNIEHLRDIFSRIPDNADVAHDTETTSLDTETADLVGISMAYDDPLDGLQAFYIPVGHTVDSYLNLSMQETLGEVVKLGNRVKFIFYNAKYDLGIYKARGIAFPNKEDAMVSVFCHDTGYKGIGLKGSSKRFFGESMIEITDMFIAKEEEQLRKKYEAEMVEYEKNLAEFEAALAEYEEAKATKSKKMLKPYKKNFNCDKVPSLEKAKISRNNLDFSALSALDSFTYAAADALQTLKIHRHLSFIRLTEKEANDSFPLVKSAGQSFIYRVENKLIDALLDMESNKVRIDTDYIRRVAPSVINDIYTTMVEVYRDLKLPNDFGNRSDFFYRMTQLPVKVLYVVEEFIYDKKGILKHIRGSINGNLCLIDVRSVSPDAPGVYKGSYTEGFLQNVKVTLYGLPELEPGLSQFQAEMVYPEKTEFFIDSPIKVGHLLFTPKDLDIDFYEGLPLESYVAEVTTGFADQKKIHTVNVKGLKERLGDKYSDDQVHRIKGFGIKGGKVTEKAGQWQTDDTTLTPLAGQNRVIESVLQYRKRKKSLSTYIMPFYNMRPAPDGNYYAKFAFRSMAAPSGRLAAGDKDGGGYIGVNAQAIPSNDGAFWVDTKKVFSR